MDDVRAGRINAVLAWHTDRLHRDTRELLDYIELSVERKMPTQTVTAGPLDLATANGRAAAITLGAWARAESEHKAERIARAHEQAAGQGRWRGGNRPFGYLADGVTLHPVESVLVANAYTAVLAGESLAGIMRAWRAAGVTTTTGKDWSYATMRQLLLRERNYGASVHRGKVVGDGQWEPLTDEPTWRAVAAILSNPTRRTSGSNQGRWLLPGLALCGVCADGTTTVKSATARSRGVSRTVYKCRSAAHLARAAEYVDGFVSEVVKGRLRRDDARDLLVSSTTGPDTDALRDQAVQLRAELADSRQLLTDRLLTAAQFRPIAERITADLAAAEAAMSGGKAGALVDLLKAPDPGDAWEALSWAPKRAVLDLLMTVTIQPAGHGKPRVFDPTTIAIEWKS